MENNPERLIKLVYQRWKKGHPQPEDSHPSEESLACFLEGKLSREEKERIKIHITGCDICAEAVALNLEADSAKIQDLPEELLIRVKNLVIPEQKPGFLEILLQLKEKAIEVMNTTGDVLLGQELVPAAILRSRKIKDFKDEVVILKDFQDIRVEARIENKAGKDFNLIIVARRKDTQEVIKDLRVTLIKEDVELESYLSDSGSVTFEHVLLGKYTVEISSIDDKLASILLEIRV